MHDKEKQKSIAEARANIYALLSRIYRKEITPELLQKLRDKKLNSTLSGMGLDFSDLFEKNEKKLIDDLAAEYCRLFIGPGPHIPPFESVHHGTFTNEGGLSGLLWGNEALKVKKFYDKLNLKVPRDSEVNIPDHIAIELEVMQYLCNKEVESGSNGKLKECREMEKEFLNEHLTQWIPSFCDAVIKSSNIKFYRDIAALTKKFIISDKDLVDKMNEC